MLLVRGGELTGEARSARIDARRVRREATEVKLHVRSNLALSRERRRRAEVQLERARTQRDEPLPSPWSELRWAHTYEPLELTLVPQD